MKITKIITVVALSSTFLMAQTPKESSIIKEGQQATKLLLETLQSNLQAHMKKGGVMDALDFCSTQAYELTDKVNAKLPKGVVSKRISINYRNPANSPQADEFAVLQSLQEDNATTMPPYILKKIDEHTYKFYKPLVINNPVCLKCHGDLSPELKAAINAKYPQDKATGYKMGDLRGAVVVTITK